MPYAISIKCLNDTALPVVELWREAAEFEEVPSMEALNYPPHMTLAVYDDIEPDRLIGAFRRAFHGGSAISIAFSGICSFRNDFLVLWLRPVSDEPLRQIHAVLHAEIEPTLCHEYYRPGSWVPHCTIAMRIPHAVSEQAIRWADERRAEFSVTFNAADCLWFHPVEIMSEILLAQRP
ncbi:MULTISPECIES: 2'-5' RNA ligase family protein [unclassified Sinorhizobium]|uniref:2'-5' RNA ligase family protein n=1 Tax=unclassified Sinorhizobium TaxID=2613772 RepID=UPI0035267CC3